MPPSPAATSITPTPAASTTASTPAPPAPPARTRGKRRTHPRRRARRRDGHDTDADGSDADAEGTAPSRRESEASTPPPAAGAVAAAAAAATAVPAAAGGASALFPDVASAAPRAWADADPNDVPEVVSFEEFNRGHAPRARGGGVGVGRPSASARGRGGKVAGAAPLARDVAPARTIADEERALLKRERQKAKRKEAKDRRREQAASAAAAGTAAAGTAAAGTAAAGTAGATSEATSSAAPAGDSTTSASTDALVASTSDLKLDDTPTSSDTPPATGPAGPAPAHGAASRPRPADPQVTPRVGNFWMHDQRHHDAAPGADGAFARPRGMPEWRGRGGLRGLPRGGFRGALRGRGRGGFGHFAPHPHHAPVPPSAAAPAPYVASDSGSRMTEMDKLELQIAQRERQKKVAAGASVAGRWGHEGFEEQANTYDAFRTNRAVAGGQRGRGRPARGLARGGGAKGFVPAHLPTPEASPDRAAAKAALVLKPEEGTTTQTTAADTLLDDGGGAVTVRLPGDTQRVEVEPAEPKAQAAPTAGPEPQRKTFTPLAPPVSASPILPAFTPSNPSPVPYVASDSGSMSSGYIPPAGVPEFFPMQPGTPAFYPAGSYPQQPFTPEPGMPPSMHPAHPHHGMHPHHRHSLSGGSGYYPDPRAGSPLNPYAPQFFYMPTHGVPPKHDATGSSGAGSSKPETAASTAGTPELAPPPPLHDYVPAGYYGYNPYGGMGMGVVPDGSVYYPVAGGYWPQGPYGDDLGGGF